ncbi:MAG: primosomal protein N' [Anaerovoracaceae bacterium]
MKYVNLVIDNKSDSTDNYYTYGCNFDDIKIGQKVYVPFNRGNKIKAAYVFEIIDEPKKEFKELKYVAEIDEDICLFEEIIDTCVFMKNRYLCRYIDAINLFTPAGKKAKRRVEGKPLKELTGEKQNINELTKEQEYALSQINERICTNNHELFLLHGVTGSGKTEVYMKAIEEAINHGKNAIMLVPEITLTKQIIDRFIDRFGKDQIAVLHSKLTMGERYDEWVRIRNGQVRIVIGARSAIFAPLQNIGVIVLDEEHEATYKSDMSPKYDTIEIAIKRSKVYNGVVIMGSATPSVVSFHRSNMGIYKKLELSHRYNNVLPPKVSIVDMGEELRSGNRSVLSKKLYDDIAFTLQKKQQVILFLNRRGHSTFVSCRDCGHVLVCEDCNISLTYHQNSQKLMCHYCGKSEKIPNSCPKCGSKYIKYFGVGTEKLELEVLKYFSEYNIGRLDFDTTQKRGEINKILNDFGKKRIDILIGTQLVAKGLDFKNVGLVGIIAADLALNIPDYRSSERAFQLITQAAGRAGRGDEQGKVIVQTYSKDNYAIVAGANQDYTFFYEQEIRYRELMDYPPFGNLIVIQIASAKKDKLIAVGEKLTRFISTELEPKRIISNTNIVSDNKKEKYKKNILIKCATHEKNKILGIVLLIKEEVKSNKDNVSVVVDIDPYSIWRN